MIYQALTWFSSHIVASPEPTPVFLDTVLRNILQRRLHTVEDLVQGSSVHHTHRGRGCRGYELHSQTYQKHNELPV